MKTIGFEHSHAEFIHKSILTCLLISGLLKAPAQNPRQIWHICLRPNGQSCNSPVSPVSSLFGLSDKIPDHGFYSKISDGAYMNWNSCIASTTIGNLTAYDFSGITFSFETDQHGGLLARMKCMEVDTFRDFFEMAPYHKDFLFPGMAFDNRNDSLVIEMYDIDTIEPFVKKGTNSEYLFALSDIRNYCKIEMPITWFTKKLDIEIFSIPKSDIIIKQNPVKNAFLQFRFLNKEIKQHLLKLEITDLNGNVLQALNIAEIQMQEDEDIAVNIDELSNQHAWFIVTTKFDTNSYPIVIAK